MYRLLKSLKRDARGATAVEYGLIVALVVLAIIIAITNVGSRTGQMWNNVATKVNNA